MVGLLGTVPEVLFNRLLFDPTGCQHHLLDVRPLTVQVRAQLHEIGDEGEVVFKQGFL